MKKNLFFKVSMLLSLAAVTVSCDCDKGTHILSRDRNEVKFSSNINMVNNRTKVSGSTWDASDAIGVYMYEEASFNIVENRKNIQYVTNLGGEKGNFEAAGTIIYFPDNGNKVRFMSYYPYQADLSVDDDVYEVDVVDQSSQSAIDLLYSFDKDAKYDKRTPNKKVPLIFDHQLTKVYVNVKAGNGLVDDDLQSIGISFNGLNTKADFDLMTGFLNNQGTPSPIDLRRTAVKSGYAASFEAIVLPDENVPVAQIIFDLNNGDTETGVSSDVYTWTFNNVLDKSTLYTYNVVINRSGIVVEATINDWLPTEDADVNAE